MDTSIAIDSEEIGLQERDEPTRTRLSAAPVIRKRALFRGYHIAFGALAVVLGIQIVAAMIVGSLFFDQAPVKILEVGNLLRLLPGWFILPLLWIGIAAIALARRKMERPTRVLSRLLRFRGDWLIRGLLILSGYPALAKSFATLKSSIPFINPFYADPLLRDIDIFLLGDDAWRLANETFPEPALLALDRVYILWFTYVIVITGVFSFTKNVRLQIRGALTFFASSFILGIVVATALSSVGPVFFDQTYGGRHFSDLGNMLAATQNERGLVAVRAMNFLLKNVGTTNIGAGISAMPSLHVSFSYFGFLLALQFRRAYWFQVFTAVFTLAILLGSVQLGWHYFTDGLVGILGVTIIWFAVGRFVDWSYREPVVPVVR